MRVPGDATLIIMAGEAVPHEDGERLVQHIDDLLRAWRVAGLPVIFVEPAAGRYWLGPQWPFGPRGGEITLRVNEAGICEGLDESLSQRGVTTLVFCGVMAGADETALVRQAASLGFRNFVVMDAIIDGLANRPIGLRRLRSIRRYA